MMNIRTAALTSVSPIAFASQPLFIANAPIPQRSTVGRDIILQALIASGATIEGDDLMKRSPDSAAMLDYWDLTDAIVDGIDAIRKGGEKWLPKFQDEETDAFNWRLKNATKFTNIYRDIIETLSSKPFEKEVSLVGDTIPETIKSFTENVDGGGSNLTTFLSLTFFNGINSAIDWIWVDHPVKSPSIVTQADAKAAGLRPYWSHVLGRNVLWATSEMIAGTETLTFLKIYEPGTPDRIRVFNREDDGSVNWFLYEKLDKPVDGQRTSFHQIDKGPISIKVIPLVPFTTGRRDGRTWRYFPAMRDAADLQIELYQQESALKFNKVMGAYSMLAGQGVKPEMAADGKTVKKITIGPSKVLYAPPNGNGDHGEWTFIQPDPAVMKFLADDNKETISQLRELGRQPLTAQSGNLTVITAAAAAGKARSVVGAWAYGLKDAAENAMMITNMWTGEKYEPELNVYTEFDEFAEGKDLDALLKMRLPGLGMSAAISEETLWEEMKRRGVLSADFDPDEERARLLAEVPSDTAPDTTGQLDLPAPKPTTTPNKPPVVK